MKRDADDVKKLITQLTHVHVFRVNTALREEDGYMDSVSCGHTLGTFGIQRCGATGVEQLHCI